MSGNLIGEMSGSELMPVNTSNILTWDQSTNSGAQEGYRFNSAGYTITRAGTYSFKAYANIDWNDSANWYQLVIQKKNGPDFWDPHLDIAEGASGIIGQLSVGIGPIELQEGNEVFIEIRRSFALFPVKEIDIGKRSFNIYRL